MALDPASPGAPSPSSRRWRKAVARICAQKAVVSALEPEPAWREFRSYAALLLSGFFFSPISQAILVTSVRATCELRCSNCCLAGAAANVASATFPRLPAEQMMAPKLAWCWPSVWWKTLPGVLRGWQSSALFALHDAVTRGRTHWVEQATDVGAVRPCRPLMRCLLLETCCGILGAQLSLEYMRRTLAAVGEGSALLGEDRLSHLQLLSLGAVAGAVRSAVVVTGGHRPVLRTVCNWLEFLLEMLAERQGALYLGHRCPLPAYFSSVIWGILNFLPWGFLVWEPVAEGTDPIVQQKVFLDKVAKGFLQQSERGHAELAIARRRAVDFFASMEISSLWWRVRAARGTCKLLRAFQGGTGPPLSPSGATEGGGGRLFGEDRATGSSAACDVAQEQLDQLLQCLAALRRQDLESLLQDADDLSHERIFDILETATDPIVVKRSDMVRSALTQIADRPVEELLLGITATEFPELQEGELCGMLGFRVQFLREDAVDVGGVRKDFMDCFAETLTRQEVQGSPLALVEPLSLLGLGADSTWRPVPCDEEDRGFLWALGRLLALALVYRSPCPLQLSLLVFKCILGLPLRPADVRQLDPDFWNHRVRPLLLPNGAEERQRDLASWGMDSLSFMSADGSRELKPGGASIFVTDENKEEYAQLLCEDFLIGPIRAEIGCLVMGFHELVPQDLILRRQIDAEQLRMLTCGSAELDVEDWEENAVISGSAEVAGWFFEWLRKQPHVMRSKMLAFATGSSVLPCGWSGLRDPYGRPLPFRVMVEGSAEALPSAHTCTNLLVLPPAPSRAALEQKLDKVLELAGREMLFA
eukprot:TRINITY_DN7938_c0_g1_i5.p1 TRINITY_DN7938_c0_g1~~TRINITY_DN7938_c0_g1_i5.p1  ORF type:complete len:827 (+),score=150.27 TRINITY_DN7938_c0_g1_i5:28-2481(+)